MQLLLHDALDALTAGWGCEVVIRRAHPVVSVADNHDRLHYPPDGVARDARYTRYVSEDELLRDHKSPAHRGARAVPVRRERPHEMGARLLSGISAERLI